MAVRVSHEAGMRVVDDREPANHWLAILGLMPEPWVARSLCSQTDPESFFPEKGGSTRDAKRVCMRCEVRAECLMYALDHDERFGIWGGLSERERRSLKKHKCKDCGVQVGKRQQFCEQCMARHTKEKSARYEATKRERQSA